LGRRNKGEEKGGDEKGDRQRFTLLTGVGHAGKRGESPLPTEEKRSSIMFWIEGEGKRGKGVFAQGKGPSLKKKKVKPT